SFVDFRCHFFAGNRHDSAAAEMRLTDVPAVVRRHFSKFAVGVSTLDLLKEKKKRRVHPSRNVRELRPNPLLSAVNGVESERLSEPGVERHDLKGFCGYGLGE